MTLIDEAPDRTASPSRRPRIVWVFTALAILFFLVGAAGGSYQGKLADVQKNDNSSFLPGSADSTKVAKAQEKFTTVQSIPGFVVYQRKGGLTDGDKAKIAADVASFRTIKGVAADEVAAPQFSGDAASVAVPLVGKTNGKSVKGPDLVDAEKAVLKGARKNAPSGLTIHSAGAGGIIVAFIDAFSGLDGALLIAAGAVVVIILLFVYRSPILWAFPIVCAVLALGAASIVIYGLAKNGTITLNGQSQGILSVLVIGAGTDYALLLISRYREELHEYDSRVEAMNPAWKGAAPPIIASAVTVILGLICLTVARLNSTAGLGPVCAIGIACTVIVMLTVLPVLLVVSGRWIFWPKRPRVDHQTDILEVHGVWGRFSRWLSTNYRRAWVSAGIVLLACVAGIFTLKTAGLSTEKGFTNTPEAITGQHIYNEHFNKGAGAPAVILTATDKAEAVAAKAAQVKGIDPDQVCIATDFGQVAKVLTPDKVKADPGLVKTVFGPQGCANPQFQVKPVDRKTLVNATLTDSYDSSAAYQTIRDVRKAVEKADPGALVGGQSAATLDVQDASRHDNKVIIPVVLLVILVVLAIVLRALIAPLLLVATVVLSFVAALGVSAVFFNHVFHFANSDPAFPLFAFVFLVALGIDYNIFLMTRVREETLGHGTHQGVVRGLAVTGGVITSAGAVLAATFVVLGVLPIVFLAEIGFAVAFGVLLDTIVVRSILVPALSHEIGKKIWWPSKLSAADARD
ncbi:MAG: MMPL family transporter [Jatrophihabitans sp.]|uniref:MMPL family transporter n=1 Tax=Jatrophihabitans sp. TaxID=1932789 RepID=UPI003911F242